MEREQAIKYMRDLLKLMVDKKGSDLFVTVDFPPAIKIDGKVTPVSKTKLTAENSKALAYAIMNDRQLKEFEATKECNFAIAPSGIGRFRVNAFIQQTYTGMVLRTIETEVPTIDQLGLPDVMKEIAMTKRGLLIMVGGTGSGKSTSLAAIINHRNENSYGHIITIEDPIEYVHPHKNCILMQREVGVDCDDWDIALKNTLRQAPDVILIGEMRDPVTISAALTAAETGHLVLATLHTNDAPSAITRLRDMGIPPFLITATLEAVLAQRLVRRICTECRAEFEPSDELLMELQLPIEQARQYSFYYGKGCGRCNNSGYKGRVGLYELMQVNDDVRDMIASDASVDDLRNFVRSQGMTSLREAGLKLIFDGHTTIDEVVRETVMEDLD